MSFFRELGKGLKLFGRSGGGVFRGSLSAAGNFFRGGNGSSPRKTFAAFMAYLFQEKGFMPERMRALFCRVLGDNVPDINPEQLWHQLENAPQLSQSELLELLAELPSEKQIQFFRFGAAMVHLKGGVPESAEKLESLALSAGIEKASFDDIVTSILKNQDRREKMFRSGAGILAALIVIAVFILTATLLRSVIFGLIAAYLLLPLEQYFERNWREKRGPGFILGKAGSFIAWLPRRLAAALSRKDRDILPTPEQLNKKQEQKIIARAVSQTVLTVFLAVCLFAGGIYALSSYYLRGIGGEMRPSAELKAAQQSVAPGEKAPARSAFAPAAELKKIREKLVQFPCLKYLIEKAEVTLHDEQTRSELTAMLWRRSGGVFSFLFNVMGFVGTLVCDLLLTLFFGLLFLMKMAEFKNSGMGGGGTYAVKTILASNWLPNVSDSTLAEAQQILSGVFSRLRIWVRGYLTLVLIDSTVYTIVFGILDVPYFPVLGIIAGCGILLPYVGPICSCLLTLLVTYLAGDAGMGQLILILASYLVYNGIIEQFILYPMVIGESLGLTTLETIIVVLLGAIFAGIAGMILALPAASVIKYLVPRIYRFWDTFFRRESPRA